MALKRLAFLLHAAVELPAALSFLFAPQRQLSPSALAAPAAPEVLLILNNLGGALLATVLMSLAVAVQGSAGISAAARGGLALALGSYHVFPCRRAWLRLHRGIGMQGPQASTFGGPGVHLAVHVVCLAALAGTGLADIMGS